MIIVFDGKFVSEIRDIDEASQSIEMFINRKGFNACTVLSTANKEIGKLENEIMTWNMEPNVDLKYIIMAPDGTVISDSLRFVEAKHTIVELTH